MKIIFGQYLKYTHAIKQDTSHCVQNTHNLRKRVSCRKPRVCVCVCMCVYVCVCLFRVSAPSSSTALMQSSSYVVGSLLFCFRYIIGDHFLFV